MQIRKIGIASLVLSLVSGVVFAQNIDWQSLFNQLLNWLQQNPNVIQQITQVVPQVQQYLGVPACIGVTFDRDLKLGMTGTDVKCLQALLNVQGCKVADTGAGSPGNETTYFGPKTKAAVICFQEKYKDEILTPIGLTAGTGYVGAKTRAKLNSILSSITLPPITPPGVSAGLNINLASDNPAAGVLLQGQVRAPLLKLVFINGDSTDGKVTKIEVKRLGIAGDTALDSIYLLDENGYKIGDEQVFSNGVAVFEDSNGLFTVGAGKSVTVTIAGNVNSSAGANYTIGVSLTNVVGTFSTLATKLPINGNLMTIGAQLSRNVTVNANGNHSTADNVRGGDTEVVVWEGTINPSHKVTLSNITLKAIGNIEPSDIQNFRFYLAGSQIGGAVNIGSDYYVRLNLAANPVTVTSGSKTLKVVADIIGGTGRSVYFEIVPSDIVATDVEYGVNIPVVLSGNSDYHTISIGTGDITLEVSSDSPVSISKAADTLVAKFVLKAYGERIKLTQFSVTSSNALVDVKIYVDGSEKASIANLNTTATVSTVFYVDAGKSATIEVKANTESYSADTLTFDLGVSGLGVKSGAAVGPASSQVVVDVSTAQFIVAFSNQPASFLALAGSEVTVAKYKIQAKSAQATIKEVTLGVVNSGSNVGSLKLVLGGNSYTGEYQGSNTWKVKNVNYTLPAETTGYAEVKLGLKGVNTQTDGNAVRVATFTVRYIQGTTETTANGGSANNVYVYKALPKVTALTTGSAGNDLTINVPTTVTLYKWKVEAIGGEINATSNTTTLYIMKSATTTITTSSIKVYMDGTDITDKLNFVWTNNLNQTGVTTGTLAIVPASGYEDALAISSGSSATFEVKIEVTAPASGWVRAFLLGDATTTTSNFVWHDGITFANGYLVEGLPAAGTDYYQHSAPSS
jgi:peptidoglycan hydrolase-like protein with peptidoglycan-binding domain